MIIYIGVDWGEKRIGLALGDSETKIATPFKTVENLDEVLAVVKEEKADKIIMGKPLSISNDQFPLPKKFLDFFYLLKEATKLPVELIDERLSSKAADALPGNKKTKAGRDEVAAMLILQLYLDKFHD